MERRTVRIVSDDQIIELYWLRDEKAIDETAGKYGSYCHTIADNILHSQEDAEECVNDTWLQAWRAIPPNRPERLKLFLAKITRNLAFNLYKVKTADKRGGGRMSVVLDELEECISDRSDVETVYLGKELGTIINRFVNQLTERDSNVFVRRYFFTESIAEIAARYRMTENYVSVSLSRTRRRLKQYLEQEGYRV